METSSVDGFVAPAELQCADPFLRAVERNMLDTVRHADEVGDDIVVEPWFRLGLADGASRFRRERGAEARAHGEQRDLPRVLVQLPREDAIGYLAAEEAMLRRGPGKDRARTRRCWRTPSATFSPSASATTTRSSAESGDEGFCGNFFFGLTWQIYRFIGNDGLLYWVYDSPETIRWLMRYLTDDKLALFDFMERERLLAPNTDTQMAGPRAYGYVSELPAPSHAGPLTLKNLWGWAESQETINISPAMYKEFVLPWLAELSRRFGLVYYGCCEPVHDRLPLIMEAIPNLRSVSVSGWSDLAKVAEMLGTRYVYSRKPTPALLSGANPPWNLARADMENTYRVTKGSCLEILLRDVYTVNHDRGRLAEWVRMTKSVFGM